MPARALIFDFNGTLSDDEHLMEAVTAEVLAATDRPPRTSDTSTGWPASRTRRWRGPGWATATTWPRSWPSGSTATAGWRMDGSTIGPAMRDVVRQAASRAPIAIVSGAARAEIEPVRGAAGIAQLFATVVTSDDVSHGKPHPEGYVIALRRLQAALPGLAAGDVVVIEDTEAGVAAAKAAGMHCLALVGTMPAARLAAADELIEAIDLALIDRLLSGGLPSG